MLKTVLEAWAIELHAVRKDIDIAGSPERSTGRFVIEDCQYRLFVLERISPGNICHRCHIARVLTNLQRNGLEDVIVYIPNLHGDEVSSIHDGYWQLSPYISGKALDRQSYVFDKWRGRVMAEFLLALRQASKSFQFPQSLFLMSEGAKPENLPSKSLPSEISSSENFSTDPSQPDTLLPDSTLFEKSEVFSIKQYIHTLSATIAHREPELMERLKPVMDFLGKEFMTAHDDMPVAFCHGDLHPLNIIWSENSIKKVIDWEFLGFKPEIYDLANLLGCLGMEDPHSLGGELVHALILESRKAGIFSPMSWSLLVEFIIALRFAWMSEWLRKNDTEMIELEMTYFELLIKNASALRDIWDL